MEELDNENRFVKRGTFILGHEFFLGLCTMNFPEILITIWKLRDPGEEHQTFFVRNQIGKKKKKHNKSLQKAFV